MPNPKPATKKDNGAKKKSERAAIKNALATLTGKSVKTMTKAEQETLLIVLGQRTGLVDETGVVKPL